MEMFAVGTCDDDMNGSDEDTTLEMKRKASLYLYPFIMTSDIHHLRISCISQCFVIHHLTQYEYSIVLNSIHVLCA